MILVETAFPYDRIPQCGFRTLFFIILKTRALLAGGQEVVCAIRRTAIRRGGAGAGSRSSVRTSSESPGWHLLGLV